MKQILVWGEDVEVVRAEIPCPHLIYILSLLLAEHPSGFNLYRDCRRIFNVICICGRMSGSSSTATSCSFTRGSEFPSLTQIPQEKALVTPFNSEGVSVVLLGRKCNYWNR